VQDEAILHMIVLAFHSLSPRDAYVNAGKKTQRLGDGLADLLALVRIAGAEDARVRRAVGLRRW
jgi:hypothetical protein